MPFSQQPLVLNVDDNTAGRYGKTRVLEGAGFRVIEAAAGEEALRLVRECRPQLVLLDLQLPDVSGLEVCRRIKSDPLTSRTPVLHISATHVTAETELTSLDSGADIFLAEPVEAHELITVVRTLLRLRTTEIGLAESEERMRLATEGAGIATWDVSLRTGAAHWNRELYQILGYPPDVPATWDMWQQRIHPDDVPVVHAAMEAARAGALFRQEHRIRRHDTGEERWLAPYGRMHADLQGDMTRFLGIVMDVTERKRADAERERVLALEQSARAEAERAARLKDEFLATLSHELRSPMSAILGWLHLARTGRLNEAEQARALETIERNAQLQNQLINDLLDVSRIVSGKLELKREALAVERLLDEAVNSVRLAAAAKEIELVRDVEPSGMVLGDAGRLQQVFTNLLSNALKFTPAGGRVEVQARMVGNWYRVEVSDNGEGIAPGVLPRLFRRFTQADGSTTRRHGGLGLGLAIVRHLVELHRGRVSAESAGLGRGSTFIVVLPVSAAPGAQAETPTRAAPAADARSRLAGARVLVVDDDPGAAQLMTHVLRSAGAVVRSASRAHDALAIAAAWPPDAMVLDIGMPETDGYTLLAELRDRLQEVSRRVPAVAVTGYAAERDRQQAIDAGFDAHMTKPFDVEALLDVVADLLGRPVA